MTSKDPTLYGFACLTLLLAAVVPSAARADQLCSGAISGSVLQSLPRPTSVSLLSALGDPNPTIAQKFLDGMQASGVTVVRDGQGTTSLDVTFAVTPRSGGGPGPAPGAHKGFEWMSAEADPTGTGWSMRGAALTLTVEAIDKASGSLAWVGSIECTVHQDDTAAVAQGLGRIVGQSLGKAISERRF
jgi:hypothetical protein